MTIPTKEDLSNLCVHCVPVSVLSTVPGIASLDNNHNHNHDTDSAPGVPPAYSDHFNMYSCIYPHKNSMR